MQKLFDKLSIASAIFLAAAALIDVALGVTAQADSWTVAALALWCSAFFCLLVPLSVLYTIIKLAVKHAK